MKKMGERTQTQRLFPEGVIWWKEDEREEFVWMTRLLDM